MPQVRMMTIETSQASVRTICRSTQPAARAPPTSLVSNVLADERLELGLCGSWDLFRVRNQGACQSAAASAALFRVKVLCQPQQGFLRDLGVAIQRLDHHFHANRSLTDMPYIVVRDVSHGCVANLRLAGQERLRRSRHADQ